MLGPWLVGIAILTLLSILLAWYYAGDIRAAQVAREKQGQGISLPYPQWLKGLRTAQAVALPTESTPSWDRNYPDAYTGATPQVMSFNLAIEIVAPSVVGISAAGGHDQSASGIIVHPRGYVLTNYHVVKGAKNIVVTLAIGQVVKSYSADFILAEPELDLALIKITPNKGRTFPVAPLGNSDEIYIGQNVIAIGNPFGLSQSASAGIVSNPSRRLTAGDMMFDNLIQTDASINPGSSGGALINAKAEVIGISTAVYSPGVGFAVPINQARRVFREFIETVPSPLRIKSASPGRIPREKHQQWPRRCNCK